MWGHFIAWTKWPGHLAKSPRSSTAEFKFLLNLMWLAATSDRCILAWMSVGRFRVLSGTCHILLVTWLLFCRLDLGILGPTSAPCSLMCSGRLLFLYQPNPLFSSPTFPLSLAQRAGWRIRAICESHSVQSSVMLGFILYVGKFICLCISQGALHIVYQKWSQHGNWTLGGY